MIKMAHSPVRFAHPIPTAMNQNASPKTIDYPDPLTPAVESLKHISVTRFVDGGVTVVIPNYHRPNRPSRRQIAGSIALGLSAVVVVPWLDGAPPWKYIPSAVVSVFQSIPVIAYLVSTTYPVPLLLALFLPWLAVLLAMIATYKVLQMPTVIGISPKTVYLDMPGTIRRRKLELPRKCLLSVEIRRYRHDDFSEGDDPAFLRLNFDRFNVREGRGWPMKDLQGVVDELNRALQQTREFPATVT
jgi:hypothetical protein